MIRFFEDIFGELVVCQVSKVQIFIQNLKKLVDLTEWRDWCQGVLETHHGGICAIPFNFRDFSHLSHMLIGQDAAKIRNLLVSMRYQTEPDEYPCTSTYDV